MTQLLSLGAINKLTGEYVYPKIANKKDLYICPECNKDLILCQGEIRIYHFRHKIDSINPCNHYSNPTESQIHKDAKLLMKTLLEKKIKISFIRNCFSCQKNEEYEIMKMTETSKIELEYRFYYDGKKILDKTEIDKEYEKKFEYLLKPIEKKQFNKDFEIKKKENYETAKIPESPKTASHGCQLICNFFSRRQLRHHEYLKIADVAYINDTNIIYIFEICHTSKTSSINRPEPWFEIDAKTLIKIANDNSLTLLEIPCIRCEKCDVCIQKIKIKELKILEKTFKIREHINDILGSREPIVCKCLKHLNSHSLKIYKDKREHHEDCPISLGIVKYTFDRHTVTYNDYQHNNKIIELFNEQLGNFRAVIGGYKGVIHVYIFDKSTHDENVVRLFEILKDTMWNHIKVLIWKYKISYYGTESRYIIYDLIQFSKTNISLYGDLEYA